ncbi:unnamed protein product [Clavelina lepadiformis]|uniref:Uncharacterized protein n=1 Tax=Clavelina lepadiformis TaxID=159417 RepID=A0ABP0GCD3_CLALP
MDDNGNQHMDSSREQRTNGDGEKNSGSEDKNKEIYVSINQAEPAIAMTKDTQQDALTGVGHNYLFKRCVSWDISPSFATLIEKVFSEHADKDHVLDLMTMVNAEMQRRETPQLEDIRTFLLRKLWLKQRDAFQIEES